MYSKVSLDEYKCSKVSLDEYICSKVSMANICVKVSLKEYMCYKVSQDKYIFWDFYYWIYIHIYIYVLRKIKLFMWQNIYSLQNIHRKCLFMYAVRPL